jgi:hypothetical protein
MNEPHIEAQRWLRQARADLAVVRTLRTAGHHAAACFYSQQANVGVLTTTVSGAAKPCSRAAMFGVSPSARYS